METRRSNAPAHGRTQAPKPRAVPGGVFFFFFFLTNAALSKIKCFQRSSTKEGMNGSVWRFFREQTNGFSYPTHQPIRGLG